MIPQRCHDPAALYGEYDLVDQSSQSAVGGLCTCSRDRSPSTLERQYCIHVGMELGCTQTMTRLCILLQNPGWIFHATTFKLRTIPRKHHGLQDTIHRCRGFFAAWFDGSTNVPEIGGLSNVGMYYSSGSVGPTWPWTSL